MDMLGVCCKDTDMDHGRQRVREVNVHVTGEDCTDSLTTLPA